MLDLTKPLQTRDGDPAVLVYVGDNTEVLHRLLDADFLGQETIVALVRGMLLGYDRNGKYISHQNNGCDLVNAPEVLVRYGYFSNTADSYYDELPPPSPHLQRAKVIFENGKMTSIELVP